MNKRQLDILAQVEEAWAGRVSTHYEQCYLVHAACLQRVLLDLEEDE